ncbi:MULTISPECIES: GntR family transcriptional regulator [Aeribacillus]|jgi:GntR family transcriptional regulator|uniref:GntR family transcriptional regulator n=1 Tax=Aeribacillus composti TaxID=1868734 RepID=A0ABY9WCX0_9BACI|nr:GntR family transcriptional regulator [Aeribacillus composti]MDR9794453.1 GntR family transcriptional regulator [Aeribacillus pallidus]REJ26083.1 MAG: phosphonate metabolism transcriptional regulator PhnF [Bacillaceae bacterium]MDR9797506.1 GntR family transcriptional regulator [Aeribacillus pallidus]MED0704092.1 GntR family transcriptional regulator [Aeribacillus composti]MED0714958.1 GntR family transcriptional regulator [Aeribacillus composti]
MIDKSSPIPIYYQLEEFIKKQIENGELQPDQAIPSEREYAERYQISRMTVRQAINNLVNEGYLYRQKGRGTFVSKQKVEQRLHGLTSFTEDMLERGMKPSSKLLSFEVIPAGLETASHLKLKKNAPVYEIKRVRLADDVPMALETTYVPANLVKGLTEEIIHQSLYSYIEEKLNLVISEAFQQIEASIAKESEIKHLQIEKGSPILLILRTSYLHDGTPFEFVKSAYRADRYKFVHTLKRQRF